MVGRYRFEFILIILIFMRTDCRPFFIFPDCSYLIFTPTFIPSRL